MYDIRKIFRALFFWRRTVLRLVDGGNNPYLLNRYLDNCYIKNGSVTVGYVQGLTCVGHQLTIEHFAVNTENRGGIKADEMIRTFAKQVKHDLPDVQTIKFDLGRGSHYYGVNDLANRRYNLLRRIGAVNIQKKRVKKNCIVVKGDWHKLNW